MLSLSIYLRMKGRKSHSPFPRNGEKNRKKKKSKREKERRSFRERREEEFRRKAENERKGGKGY